ncbi:MAG: hypothetical protein NXI27_12095 [Alphaproteobacteria bacterium]|nr:hypothetical protein [Alphaproteobacteria bacterium]
MISDPKSLVGRAVQLAVAIAISGAMVVYGDAAYDHRMLEKYPPDWSLFGWFKALALLFASFLVFLALRPEASQLRVAHWDALPAGWLTVGLCILAASALAVIAWPTLIADYVREGRALSVLTEFIFLAALALLAVSAWSARGSDRAGFFGIRPVWILLAMIAVVLLILMEEMSWGQHWLGFATPDGFEKNLQNETNLHNFYTHRFEAAYYSTAVLVFVVLPFAWPREVPSFADGLTVFVPPLSFAILALPLCGLFYETWNFVMYQVWFYLGVLIAIFMFQRETEPAARRGIATMLAALLLSQLVFLLLGHTLRDGHELTEIREVAIPLALVAYCWILMTRFRRDADLSAKRPAQN